jgi:GNAT superfamily N-acetyltransferase
MKDDLPTLEPAVANDAEELVQLRIAAMRESLEGLGRFDPQRARGRFLKSFEPSLTRHIIFDSQKVGFLVVRPVDGHLLLDHLYIHPTRQGKGIGAAVLATVFTEADELGMAVRVGALRESASNRFYLRHGFELVEVDKCDNYYVRKSSVPAQH